MTHLLTQVVQLLNHKRSFWSAALCCNAGYLRVVAHPVSLHDLEQDHANGIPSFHRRRSCSRVSEIVSLIVLHKVKLSQGKLPKHHVAFKFRHEPCPSLAKVGKSTQGPLRPLFLHLSLASPSATKIAEFWICETPVQ